jgi:hypothetical protein
MTCMTTPDYHAALLMTADDHDRFSCKSFSVKIRFADGPEELQAAFLTIPDFSFIPLDTCEHEAWIWFEHKTDVPSDTPVQPTIIEQDIDFPITDEECHPGDYAGQMLQGRLTWNFNLEGGTWLERMEWRMKLKRADRSDD